MGHLSSTNTCSIQCYCLALYLYSVKNSQVVYMHHCVSYYRVVYCTITLLMGNWKGVKEAQ